MDSVIISTTYLLIVGIISILIALASLILKETKALPLINLVVMMFVCIASLFLGSEIVEPLIFVCIHLLIYFSNIFFRHKEEL